MAHTKQLLDAVDISELIDRVEVVQEDFTDEETKKTIVYNRLLITLANGDQMYAKMPKENKLAVYYAIRENDSSK